MKGRRYLLSWRVEDDGFMKALQEIVETKVRAGIDTCLGRELIRLAKNGLFNDTKGYELDVAAVMEIVSRADPKP
jgi:hypothetical protein